MNPAPRLEGSLPVNNLDLFTLTILAIEIEIAFTGKKPSTALRVRAIVGKRSDSIELKHNGETFRWEGNL